MRRKATRVLAAMLALMMALAVPFAANAAAETIALGDVKNIDIAAGQRVEFIFTPTQSGWYALTSEFSDLDVVAYLYDAQGGQLAYNDDNGMNYNFNLTYEMTAGTQYTYAVQAHSPDGAGSGTVKLANAQHASEIAFEKDSMTAAIGENFQLNVSLFPQDSIYEGYRFTSSKPSVVRIGEQGNVLAVGSGTATITVTSDNGLTDTMKITVAAPTTLKAGDSYLLSTKNQNHITFKFVAPATGTYSFYSTGEGDPACEIFDSSVNLIAGADDVSGWQFKATFDAEKGKTYYLYVHDYDEPAGQFTVHLEKAGAATGIAFEYAQYTGYVGDRLYPTVITKPYSAVDENYTLTSSNTAVVEIVEGDINIVGVGTATLTATTESGKKATTKINVVAPKAITANKYYTQTNTINVPSYRYTFTPTESGTYYLDFHQREVWVQVGIFGIEYNSVNVGDEWVTAYELTAGTEYTIYAEGPWDHTFTFYLFKEGKDFCATTGHKWDKGTVTLKATTLSFGSKVYTCSVCKTTKTEWIKPVESNKKATAAFSDVKKGNWFEKNGSIDFVYNSGLFAGVGGGRFDPNGNMTRGMFVTVLGRLSGVKENKNATTKFTDVKKGNYYTGYVKWASEAGIVNGTSETTFAPEDNVTREQICKMMVTYCDYIGVVLRTDDEPITFKDAGKISSWAKTYVSICQKAGLINGEKTKGGFNFNPLGNATRAEVATILYNFVKNYL